MKAFGDKLYSFAHHISLTFQTFLPRLFTEQNRPRGNKMKRVRHRETQVVNSSRSDYEFMVFLRCQPLSDNAWCKIQAQSRVRSASQPVICIFIFLQLPRPLFPASLPPSHPPSPDSRVCYLHFYFPSASFLPRLCTRAQ